MSDQTDLAGDYAVWKFPLVRSSSQIVVVPGKAEILHVGLQHDRLTMWARCRPGAEPTSRWITIVGTGHPSPAPAEAAYIGTVMEGSSVWHLFDGGPSGGLAPEQP